MRHVMIFACLGLAVACQTAPPNPPPFTLVDLSDDFASFYDRSRSMAPDERAPAFRAEMAEAFPGFYDPARFRGATIERYDRSLANAIEQFPSIRDAYTRTGASFESMLAPAHDSFVQSFPDLASMGDIYLLHSLGEMDGGTRTIGGRQHLVFGADVISRIHAPGEERPFFHHELFHVYHHHFFEGCDLTWCDLWQEGLATHVAHELNPAATDKQLLLEFPRPIRPAVETDRAAAVCAIRANMDQPPPPGFFQGGREPGVGTLPPRFAYYVGYLVAREAARTHSVQDLSKLSNETARPVIDAALAALATCSSTS